MAAKKKKVDPVKQREKRVKVAAIIGTVLFLAVAAYEVPSMLAVMNKKPPPGSTIDNGPSSVLPNVAGGGSAAPAASTGQLVNTDVPPTTGEGQLVSFSVFETKNPFTPQVSSDQAPPDSGATTTTPSTADKPGADVPGGTTTTPTREMSANSSSPRRSSRGVRARAMEGQSTGVRCQVPGVRPRCGRHRSQPRHPAPDTRDLLI